MTGLGERRAVRPTCFARARRAYAATLAKKRSGGGAAPARSSGPDPRPAQGRPRHSVPREGVEPSRPGFVDPAPHSLGRGKQFSAQESNLSAGLRKPSTDPSGGESLGGMRDECKIGAGVSLHPSTLIPHPFRRSGRQESNLLARVPKTRGQPMAHVLLGRMKDQSKPPSRLVHPSAFIPPKSRRLESNQLLRVFSTALQPC